MLPIVVFGVPRSTEIISIHDLSASAPPTEILFFSFQENTHQSSAGLHSVLVAPMNAGGILMTFSANLGALSDSVLSAYDGTRTLARLATLPPRARFPHWKDAWNLEVVWWSFMCRVLRIETTCSARP